MQPAPTILQRLISTSNAAPVTQVEIERRTFTVTFNLRAGLDITIEISLRHSNLAQMPFFHDVDEVFVRALNSYVFSAGCLGTGSFVPVLNSVGFAEFGPND